MAANLTARRFSYGRQVPVVGTPEAAAMRAAGGQPVRPSCATCTWQQELVARTNCYSELQRWDEELESKSLTRRSPPTRTLTLAASTQPHSLPAAQLPPVRGETSITVMQPHESHQVPTFISSAPFFRSCSGADPIPRMVGTAESDCNHCQQKYSSSSTPGTFSRSSKDEIMSSRFDTSSISIGNKRI